MRGTARSVVRARLAGPGGPGRSRAIRSVVRTDDRIGRETARGRGRAWRDDATDGRGRRGRTSAGNAATRRTGGAARDGRRTRQNDGRHPSEAHQLFRGPLHYS